MKEISQIVETKGGRRLFFISPLFFSLTKHILNEMDLQPILIVKPIFSSYIMKNCYKKPDNSSFNASNFASKIFQTYYQLPFEDTFLKTVTTFAFPIKSNEDIILKLDEIQSYTKELEENKYTLSDLQEGIYQLRQIDKALLVLTYRERGELDKKIRQLTMDGSTLEDVEKEIKADIVQLSFTSDNYAKIQDEIRQVKTFDFEKAKNIFQSPDAFCQCLSTELNTADIKSISYPKESFATIDLLKKQITLSKIEVTYQNKNKGLKKLIQREITINL